MIVDDQAMIRRGVRLVIDTPNDLRVFGEDGTPREAFEMAARTFSQVVLLELSLPGEWGVAAFGAAAGSVIAVPGSRLQTQEPAWSLDHAGRFFVTGRAISGGGG